MSRVISEARMLRTKEVMRSSGSSWKFIVGTDHEKTALRATKRTLGTANRPPAVAGSCRQHPRQVGSLDDLVGDRQKTRGHRDPECSCRLQIHEELEAGH